ncbi:hypothetical protein LAV84_23815 [Rhizobium sp. VS19-DR104.2]|uniref:hypothetical protein n=1 Tax=unclassified Rhizobium TaxID=2613769 RepID=UPI001CC822B3|nr:MULTISPECIES: hypothetical protein [unclassified Rhizobium]MBZ5762287.1 hypothetical protein [Rhizobium sp. VS19-DR96]MBZ5768303.1 hypothetical protein [Rhizobium sp. VS19-DR129.2]MBZ5775825.1 hypothetical protein [Rhizobium sp. VS19-DRK62.2]MBZ5787154.1 hypothetical protein [Rhizobium sp. VS19-DR121]MBZ5804229.1 hypothetical protein [Rhizobium sp. VS19-DR181]
MLKKVTASVVSLALVAPAVAAQDRSACYGIYCPQTKASNYAAEFGPYVQAGKTWQQVKGQNILVIKYYRPDGAIADTITYPQTRYMQPVRDKPGSIAFSGDGTPTIALHGLQPCTKGGPFAFQGEKVTCTSLWQDRLSSNLFGTQAILCRAYVDQVDKPVQQATCIREEDGVGKNHKPAGIVIDDALVGLGVVTLAKDVSGKVLRPDLTSVATQGAKMFNALSQ